MFLKLMVVKRPVARSREGMMKQREFIYASGSTPGFYNGSSPALQFLGKFTVNKQIGHSRSICVVVKQVVTHKHVVTKDCKNVVI